MTKKSTKTNKPSEKTSIDKEIVDDNFEIERFASVINPTKEILDLLRKSSGLTAKAIAEQLDADRNDINKLLYGNLKGQVWQDNNYEWRIKDSSSTSIKIGKEKNFSLTDLDSLCSYYLSCLSHDNKGISIDSGSNFYEELGSFPNSTEELLSEESCQRLLGKKRADRTNLEMYFGYPIHLKHQKTAKLDNHYVDPLFLFPVKIDSKTKTTTLDTSTPIINRKILHSFTNVEQDNILDELVILEDELGIGADDKIIEFDELLMRLQNIRSEWPWFENIDPKKINSESQKLSEIKTEGIFNKAIVVLAKKELFTLGLESELTDLSKLNYKSLKGTALGAWLKGNLHTNEKIDEESSDPLIEVLPMNSEQRLSVHSSFNQDLTVITGPPGTGKSQVVTNLLINAAWQGKKVLFASKNNKAVDVVESRVNSLGPRPILLRLGSQDYFPKLANYLMSFLSTKSIKTDQLEFDEAKEKYSQLQGQSDSFIEEIEKLIENRNLVDRLEQSVEDIRPLFDEEIFLSFKAINTSKLNTNLKTLSEEIEKLIENRNQVDKLELSVEEIKSRLDEKTFLSFKTIDIAGLREDITILTRLITSLKTKGLFWFLRKNSLFITANTNLKQVTQFVENLGLTNPHNQITESNIGDWSDFIHRLEEIANDGESASNYFSALEELQSTELFKVVNKNLETSTQFIEVLGVSNPDDLITPSNLNDWKDFTSHYLKNVIKNAESVSKYLNALEKLQNTKSLEDISLEKQQLFLSISKNSEKLWEKWLRLQPSKLSSEDRDKLAKYIPLIKMVNKAASGTNISQKVRYEYDRLRNEIAHLLSCWAVTSLSVKGRLPFEPGIFDIVVFDESSQCDIASALPLLYRAKTAVVIGDPQQLSHITDGLQRGGDEQLLIKYNLLTKYPQWAYSYNSLFDLAVGLSSQNSIVNLVDHHRSHADIIEFSNKEFYQGRLRVATRYDNLKLVSQKEPGIRWINVKGHAKKPAYNTGAINPEEVRAIVDELVELVLNKGYKGTIGIVTPFVAQANSIRVAVNNHNELDRALVDREFLVDTVHKFQGDERDVIFFSPVLSKGIPQTSINFLKTTPNIFNVGITRARAQLIVVGDLAECNSCEVDYLSKFAQYSQDLIKTNGLSNQTPVLEYGGSRFPVVDNPEQVSDWERVFYTELHIAGIKTLPQYRVEKYALDLAIIDGKRKLDIEVDGKKYHQNWTGELCYRDQIRNQRLIELGWDVMRFWVYEIRDDLPTCIERIKKWQAQA